jgi:hypothetical protein
MATQNILLGLKDKIKNKIKDKTAKPTGTALLAHNASAMVV